MLTSDACLSITPNGIAIPTNQPQGTRARDGSIGAHLNLSPNRSATPSRESWTAAAFFRSSLHLAERKPRVQARGQQGRVTGVVEKWG